MRESETHHLSAACIRHLPADQPRIAALRDDGGSRFIGEFEDGGDFGCGAGLEDKGGLSVETVAVFDEVRGDVMRRSQRVFFAGDGGELGDEGGCEHGRACQFG